MQSLANPETLLLQIRFISVFQIITSSITVFSYFHHWTFYRHFLLIPLRVGAVLLEFYWAHRWSNRNNRKDSTSIFRRWLRSSVWPPSIVPAYSTLAVLHWWLGHARSFHELLLVNRRDIPVLTRRKQRVPQHCVEFVHFGGGGWLLILDFGGSVFGEIQLGYSALHVHVCHLDIFHCFQLKLLRRRVCIVSAIWDHHYGGSCGRVVRFELWIFHKTVFKLCCSCCLLIFCQAWRLLE